MTNVTVSSQAAPDQTNLSPVVVLVTQDSRAPRRRLAGRGVEIFVDGLTEWTCLVFLKKKKEEKNSFGCVLLSLAILASFVSRAAAGFGIARVYFGF